MAFTDDEQPLPQNPGNPRGRVKEETICKKKALAEETDFKALVKITGQNAGKDVHGVDIVAVLDVSLSMNDDKKLEKMKTAMEFFIRKLSSMHRLSIVTFAKTATRLSPLRNMTNEAQLDMEKMVKGLTAQPFTNITAGLQVGVNLLKDRKFSNGRVGAILLMSDGAQNAGGDARQVPVGDFPVYTFGFGKDYDAAVMNDIAKNSNGGTFSFANVDDLTKSFAQCLAGLMTVVVADLQVTITPVTSPRDGHQPTIQKVAAGSYKTVNVDGAVTVFFGDLYVQETRKIVVDFLFPAVNAGSITRFIVTYKYTNGGRDVNSAPHTVPVERVEKVTEKEPEELEVEGARLQTTRMMRGAREDADGNKLDDAKVKLVEARSLLDDVEVEEKPNQDTLDKLKTEVQTLKNYMASPEMYKAIGKAFALASETSHDRQRFASRGDDDNVRTFATPRMDAYLDQAKGFDQNPEKPVLTTDQDVEEELKKDPLALISPALSYYLQNAIESLQAIKDILDHKDY